MEGNDTHTFGVRRTFATLRAIATGSFRKRFLRADLLRAGDVILSSGYAVKDRIVVLATSKGSSTRHYYHAALVIAPGIWLESTGEGTGLTYLPTIHRGAQLLIDVSSYRSIDVFRSADEGVAKLPWHSDEFRQLLLRFVGFEYPSLDALAETTAWLESYPELKRRILKRLTPAEVVNPGLFCSQLIVEIYESLRNAQMVEHGLLLTDKPSRTISPNDLADSTISRLKKVDSVIELSKSPVEASEYDNQMDVILNSMGKVGNKMRNAVVRSNSQVKHVENFASYLTSITMELAIGNASIFQKMGGRLLQTEDKPVVELIPSQPALQELQENALKAGLNPAWLRLEGLASLYIFHRDRMMEAIITTAEAATGLVKVINGVQTKDTTRLIRKNIKLVRDMSREIDRGRHTVDSYCSMQARPGFPSDMVWVDFIVTSATTYSTVVTDYSNVLVVLEESCANADLPWFGTVTLKAYLAEVRHLKSAVTAYAQSLQMFIDWISAVDTDASELT